MGEEDRVHTLHASRILEGRSGAQVGEKGALLLLQVLLLLTREGHDRLAARCHGGLLGAWAVRGLPLAPRLFSFPFSLQDSFSENSVEIVKFWPPPRRPGSEPSLRLGWAQNQPNFRPNRRNAGNFAETPCIPGNYPAIAWVFCRFVRLAPRGGGAERRNLFPKN